VGVAEAEPQRPRAGRLLRNTAIFSLATGLSRIAGLAREIVAAAYYGTSAAASAFTIAFQVPNLLRALVADAALSAAFVPVFTELLEQGRRRDAIGLAAALFGLILAVLGAISAAYVALAPAVIPLFTADTFTPADDALTVGLSQVMAPIVVLLGLNGLVVGILQSHDHFSVPALSALVWNLVIIAALVALQPLFDQQDEIYAYAVGVLAATIVQFAMCLPVLKTVGFPLKLSLHWRDPLVKRVLYLMLPVTIGLGLINVNLVVNSFLATYISDAAPRAIDAAFRIYMLPQGMFSVAVATVLFPTLARLAAQRDTAGLRQWSATGLRQILLLLVPCSAAILVLAEPIVATLYEFGEFGPRDTELVAEALTWFALALPLNGATLMLTRTFFSLQRPWTPTALAVANLLTNTAVSVALYEPLGIAGIVIGTAVGNLVMVAGEIVALRRLLSGFQLARTLDGLTRIAVASAVLAGVAALVHAPFDADGKLEEVATLTLALTAGGAAYVATVLALGVPEARQLGSRLRRS
jgi:putative peptidoglycan lipid II flippase